MSAPGAHDFRERLAFSQAAGDEPFWLEVYRSAFPDFVSAVANAGDNKAQRDGTDRWVHLSCNKVLTIDEKKREDSWPDFAIEFQHQHENRRVEHGWILKPLPLDYIAYGFMPERTAYLLPFQQLKQVWRTHGSAWRREASAASARAPRDWKRVAFRQGYFVIRAQNRGYQTYSIAVPRADLLAMIRDALTVSLGGA